MQDVSPLSPPLKSGLTPLSYLILGLIGSGVTTGYAISEVLKHTPMRVYSSSPGSIYPAINRLKAAGFVGAAQSVAAGKAPLGLTPSGAEAFQEWLKRPVSADDVEHSSEELLLRFAFMTGQVPLDVMTRFLTEFRDGLLQHRDQIATFGATNLEMSVSGRLALEAGGMRIAAYIDWCDRAVERLKEGNISHA